jgi:subtilase family serine protease
MRRFALGLFLSLLPAVANASGLTQTPHAAFRDLGHVAALTPIRLTVVLNYRNEPELERYVARMGDPSAASSTRPLTAQEFRDAFAPTAADYATTQLALARLGLRVTRVYTNRSVIDVAAPASLVERAFSTRIDMVRRANGSLGYANVIPAFVPAGLQRTVMGVAGFDNVGALRTYNRRGRRNAAKPGPLQGPDTGLAPLAIQTAYDLPVLHGYDGKGQAAAVVIDADFLDSDLARFLKTFHIARNGPATVRVLVDGGPQPGLTQDSTEASLDVQTIVGNAPGIALYVYETDSLQPASVLDAYNQINADDKVGAVNSSFGMCETQTMPANFPQLANHLALQGAALGITYAAATGDTGTAECTYIAPGGVAAPASGTHFVAVGGTTLLLHADGTRISELGWPGSGGGLSAIFKEPAYQNGVARVSGPMRNMPDIAFEADPGSGVAFFMGGVWEGPIGGTSLASPILVALVSELAQYRGARVGNLHNALYGTYKASGYGPKKAPQFYDAVGGTNGYWYTTRGYDAVTGIGSIDGWNFANGGHPAVAGVVTLKYRHANELERLIENSTDPASPMYGRFLTQQQFRDYFAPTQAEYDTAISALRRAGFGIARVWANRTIVDVTAPVASNRAQAAASLPFVDRVVLDSGPAAMPRNFAQRAAAPASLSANGPDGGYGPNVFTQILNFPTRHGFNGTGTSVADVIDGAPDDAQVGIFLKYFGIARAVGRTTVVHVNPGNAPDQDLANIDAEWILGTAPGVHLYAYQMPVYNNVGLLDAYTKVVEDNVVDVANISLSRCENSQVDMALSLVPIFQQGAAQGISFENVSFGGVSGCFVKNRLFPLIPADMQDGLAVGSTNAIENAGKLVAQSGMPNSGGGVSELFPVLPEQSPIAGIDAHGRNVPDVSVVSEINGSGASLYFENGWNGNFIFTNSNPLAGLIAEYKQMTGHRLGAFDRTLYRLFARNGYANGLLDITSGCNGTYLGHPYCAKTGYDLTTGIGSLTDAYALGLKLKR